MLNGKILAFFSLALAALISASTGQYLIDTAQGETAGRFLYLLGGIFLAIIFWLIAPRRDSARKPHIET